MYDMIQNGIEEPSFAQLAKQAAAASCSKKASGPGAGAVVTPTTTSASSSSSSFFRTRARGLYRNIEYENWLDDLKQKQHSDEMLA